MKNSLNILEMMKVNNGLITTKETGISSQLVLQNYMLVRLLERISLSKYKEIFF